MYTCERLEDHVWKFEWEAGNDADDPWTDEDALHEFKSWIWESCEAHDVFRLREGARVLSMQRYIPDGTAELPLVRRQVIGDAKLYILEAGDCFVRMTEGGNSLYITRYGAYSLKDAYELAQALLFLVDSADHVALRDYMRKVTE